MSFFESTVEVAALAWLEDIGWRVAHGPDIAPDMPAAERTDHGEVVLPHRLRAALARLDPGLPPEALDDAFRRVLRTEAPTLLERATGRCTACWSTASRSSTGAPTARSPAPRRG